MAKKWRISSSKLATEKFCVTHLGPVALVEEVRPLEAAELGDPSITDGTADVLGDMVNAIKHGVDSMFGEGDGGFSARSSALLALAREAGASSSFGGSRPSSGGSCVDLRRSAANCPRAGAAETRLRTVPKTPLVLRTSLTGINYSILLSFKIQYSIIRT